MKTSERQKMNQDIQEHGEILKKMFRLPEDTDPTKLCKKIKRIETVLHQAATDYCNGFIEFEEVKILETKKLNLLDKTLKFRSQYIPVFFNTDPRGYALKIDFNRNCFPFFPSGTDGFGIICPNFTPQ